MSDLFDSDFFGRLNRLKLAMHIRLDRGLSGSRKSSEKGSSVEFSDFREYIPGDDIRRIDWNVYGRLDKLYVKQFMEEKEAFYHIFLDSSASMDFGEKKKSVMALRLAAVFSWLVLRQLDRVEILSLKNGRLAKSMPTCGRGSFQLLLKSLEEQDFSGYTGINEAIKRYPLNGKGICILISDFLDPEGIDEALRYLLYKGQEVLLVQVLAKEETDFNEEGTLSLTDMEDGSQVMVTMTGQAVKTYQEAVENHTKKLMKTAKRYGCGFVRVLSDEDLDKVVFMTLKEKGIFA